MSVEKYEISDSYLSLTGLVIGIEQRHDWSKEELKNLYRLPFNVSWVPIDDPGLALTVTPLESR